MQDLLRADSSTIYKQLVQEGGHLYVCGDVSMASGVCKALEDILAKGLGLNAQEAKGYIMMMREKNRYHEDIFGATLKISEIQHTATAEIAAVTEGIHISDAHSHATQSEGVLCTVRHWIYRKLRDATGCCSYRCGFKPWMGNSVYPI